MLGSLIVTLPLVLGFSGGSGTPDDPYEISTCQNLQNMENDMSAHYELINNVNCSGFSYSSVGQGTYRFEGVLNGQGYAVENLEINEGESSYVGLIGYLDNTGELKNIGLINVDITGDYHVGSLVGFNQGSVTSSFSTGSVTGGDNAGGLVGFNQGSVSSSFSTGSVSGDGDVGGFIGYHAGSVSSSYSTGSVTGSDNMGGFIGADSGIISSSYWDTESSGQSSGTSTDDPAVTGLTTSEMQGISAESNMDGLDFSNTWCTITEYYPGLEVFGRCSPPAYISNLQPNGPNLNPEGGVELSATVDIPNDQNVDITFYDASDDSVIEELNNVPEGRVSTTWNDVSSDQNLSWYVEASDPPIAITSDTAYFTTIDVQLDWEDNSDVESGFRIYSNSSGNYQQITQVPPNTENLTLYRDNLEFGKTVLYGVTAYNSFGETEPTQDMATPVN